MPQVPLGYEELFRMTDSPDSETAKSLTVLGGVELVNRRVEQAAGIRS
jgi:hypothetical protein